jgi:hypothetical protein
LKHPMSVMAFKATLAVGDGIETTDEDDATVPVAAEAIENIEAAARADVSLVEIMMSLS